MSSRDDHEVIVVVRVTRDGRVEEPWLLAAAERVHRQLRPHLPAGADAYSLRLAEICCRGGADMCVAISGSERGDPPQTPAVLGLAVFRHYENTFDGTRFYVDDLVTDETQRSKGVGHALMDFLRKEARGVGAKSVTLESGVQRQQTHKFYFREGMVIKSFSFAAPLPQNDL